MAISKYSMDNSYPNLEKTTHTFDQRAMHAMGSIETLHCHEFLLSLIKRNMNFNY